MDTARSISRRDLFRLARRYGVCSTLLAATSLGGSISLSRLAQATADTAAARSKQPAKYTLRYGASDVTQADLEVSRSGCLEFVRDLEERTDGVIRVEFYGDNSICTQQNCVKKAINGDLDLFTSSTQNASGIAPYLNVWDFPYLFPSNAAQYHFLYHPGSERIMREPLRRRHGLHFLFSLCELRSLFMSLKWKERPLITRLEELKGTKNRATNSQFGQLAMQLLGLNPLPITWNDTQKALRLGLIDGAETWMSAAALGMPEVISQVVDLRFFCGAEATLMNAAVFDRIEPELQTAIMESAYLTQILVQHANEASLVKTVGATAPPLPGTLFAKHNIRLASLSDEERHKAEQKCSPEFRTNYWEPWRERLFKWSGGIDTYAEIHRIAREIPTTLKAENVTPRRWWKSDRA
ncbi:MAG: TRAP transporter substrate-binding protein DctP [Amphritea sp.]